MELSRKLPAPGNEQMGRVSGFVGIAGGEETETRRIFSNLCVYVNGIFT